MVADGDNLIAVREICWFRKLAWPCTFFVFIVAGLADPEVSVVFDVIALAVPGAAGNPVSIVGGICKFGIATASKSGAVESVEI